MSRTSKSPRKVALEALAVAQQTLPMYAHRFSPHKFTQHQLFALLVLKTHQRQDYRGIVALLEEMPQLVQALGLTAVPHYTTLQKAAERLLTTAAAQQLLGATVRRFEKKETARPTSRSISPRPTRRAWTRPAPAATSSAAGPTSPKRPRASRTAPTRSWR